MRTNAIIQIKSADTSTGHYDDNGVWVTDSNIILNKSCFVEPYSKQQAIYKYGIDTDITERAFMQGEFPTVKECMTGTWTDRHNNTHTFEIKATPWDYRYTILLLYSRESVSS